MKRNVLLAGVLLILAAAAVEEGWAAPRLLNVRRWSSPEFTRVVLDLDSPAAYEIQSAANSSVLIVYLPKLVLPSGAREIIIDDRVIRKVMLDPGEKTRVTFFLHQPTRWKVFALGKPDRVVIDIFKPASPPEMAKTARAELEEKTAAPEKTVPPKRAEPPAPPEPSQKPEEPPKIPQVPHKRAEPAAKPEEPRKAEPSSVPETLPGPEAKAPRLPALPPVEEPRPKETGSKATSTLLDIRHWAAPDHTRVVIDLKGAPEYEILPGTDPLVSTLVLRRTALPGGPRDVPVSDRVIQRMKVEAAGAEATKVTLFLVSPAGVSVFLLKPYQDKPDRLVVDISRPDLEQKEKVERQVTRELKAGKKKIVVLDPGHGGEDPGAIGPRGTQEKNVVLALAQTLQKALDSGGEVRAVLTRRADYFVPLSERVKIAQEYGADLFISLHANGNRNRQIRGTSIYCLSLQGASDTATQLLAQKENSSDLIGGTSGAPARRDLDSILLDLKQTHSINESLQLGGLALSELGRVNAIQFSRPRQAGFAVLKAPEFPAILVETAHLTHASEEALLRDRSFQERISQAISAAVKKFMPRLAGKEEEAPPRGEGKPRAKRGA